MIRFWFKLFYAVEFVGVGIFMPYIAMYFMRKDLTSAQVGTLLALTPFAGFIVQPVWGMISDKLNVTRLLVTIGCWSTSVLVLAFTVTDRFEHLVWVVVLMSMLRAPIHPNVAALALDHLEQRGKQDEYGKFRLWGSIGFIVATIFAGGLLFEDNLTLTIYIYAGTMFVIGGISFKLPDRHISTEVQWKDGLRLIADNRELRLFLLGIICIGLTLGITNQYLVVYLNELNASAWMIGATVAFSALPEIPIMSYAETFIRKWGLRITMVVGVIALPIRWLCNMLITDPNIALPIQALHGVAIGSLLCVGVIYIDSILPKTWRASGQALYVSSLHGLGPSIGLFLAGLLMSSGSTRILWSLCLGVGIIGCYIVNSAMSVRNEPIPEVR
ncbi:MAG TPA: MFS transporter [Anaerolineales bacterium]|nr:MFS transporter [Anaerolineales bacterium]|tara:strand:- start:1307 stop:2464 length:1158 start_codon:yes stop_codon:yes gene_type:complete